MRERHALIRYYYSIINEVSVADIFSATFVNPSGTKIVYTGRMEFTVAAQLTTDIAASIPATTEDLEALLRLYKPKVFRFILASLRDKDAAETLTQDCFLRAYLSRERFRGECSVDTWLMQIAVNLVRDYARNRRLQFWRRAERTGARIEDLGNELIGGERSPELNVVLREQVEAVWIAAQSLSERQRTVFLLRFVEDMDLLEIAAATGMKEGTVKTHLFRALKTVRERIATWRPANI
ncbi:MAG TPA: RNA polymerase sigma factor [Bryobacteraceae bacterium]|jgi:RNA polymerase sigma-70 factor (ECF subfamily)|nr:RNA polymerase sigma factor [Bryobacteraceae bacterium]